MSNSSAKSSKGGPGPTKSPGSTSHPRGKLSKVHPADPSQALSDFDAETAAVMERGCIALLSVFWLLKTPPARISARQTLPSEAFVPWKKAARLLRLGKRKVLVLSYGWNSPGDPDPTGKILTDVTAFLQCFVKEHRIADDELHEYGLFWDVASLYQNWKNIARTSRQEVAFRRSLQCMAKLYASAIGTCVIRHESIAPRPADFAARICVFTKRGVSEEALKKALPESNLLKSLDHGMWFSMLTYESEDEASRVLRILLDKVNEGNVMKGACNAWNDRPIKDRGWCELEISAAYEALSRQQQLTTSATSEVELACAQVMGAINIPKLINISEPTSPKVLDKTVEAPQTPAQVQDRLRKATFTSPADKGRVVRMYLDYRRELFAVMDLEGKSLLGLDNRLVRRADAQMRLGFGGEGRRHKHHPATLALGADHVARQQERARSWAGRTVNLLHVAPIGLVQFADYVSDVLVLLQFRADGDHESFVVGTVFVILSIAVVWIIAVALLIINFCEDDPGERQTRFLRRHTRNAMLLSPFNLHVLYFGAMYAEAKKEVDNSTNYNADAETLYFCFCICKVLETGLESIILSVLTAAAIFSPGGEGDSPLVLYFASLSLSVVSMGYGFFTLCAWSDKTFADESAVPGSRLHGRRGGAFISVLVHVAWTLAALGACWGTRSLGAVRILLPFSLLAAVYVGGAILALSLFIYLLVLYARHLREEGFKLPTIKLKDAGTVAFIIILVALLGVPLSIEGMAVDLAIFAAPLCEPVIASGIPVDEDPSDFFEVFINYLPFLGTRFLPGLRRGLLLAMACASMVEGGWMRAVALGVLQLVDVVGSTHLWHMLGLINWPPWAKSDRRRKPGVIFSYNWEGQRMAGVLLKDHKDAFDLISLPANLRRGKLRYPGLELGVPPLKVGDFAHMAIENDIRTGTECCVSEIAGTGEWWMLEPPKFGSSSLSSWAQLTSIVGATAGFCHIRFEASRGSFLGDKQMQALLDNHTDDTTDRPSIGDVVRLLNGGKGLDEGTLGVVAKDDCDHSPYKVNVANRTDWYGYFRESDVTLVRRVQVGDMMSWGDSSELGRVTAVEGSGVDRKYTVEGVDGSGRRTDKARRFLPYFPKELEVGAMVLHRPTRAPCIIESMDGAASIARVRDHDGGNSAQVSTYSLARLEDIRIDTFERTDNACFTHAQLQALLDSLPDQDSERPTNGDVVRTLVAKSGILEGELGVIVRDDRDEKPYKILVAGHSEASDGYYKPSNLAIVRRVQVGDKMTCDDSDGDVKVGKVVAVEGKGTGRKRYTIECADGTCCTQESRRCKLWFEQLIVGAWVTPNHIDHNSTHRWLARVDAIMEDQSMCRIRYLADGVTEDHKIFCPSGSRLKGFKICASMNASVLQDLVRRNTEGFQVVANLQTGRLIRVAGLINDELVRMCKVQLENDKEEPIWMPEFWLRKRDAESIEPKTSVKTSTSTSPAHRPPLARGFTKKLQVPAARTAAIEGGYIRAVDMLDGLLLQTAGKHAARADERGSFHNELSAILQATCRELIASLAEKTSDERKRIDAVLADYMPSPDDLGELLLLHRLKQYTSHSAQIEALEATAMSDNADVAVADAKSWLMEDVPLAADSRVNSGEAVEHPMRGVPLVYALQAALWTREPRYEYDLSVDVTGNVDWFVSHARSDGAGAKKVAMLREFLCLQALIGRVCIIAPMLGAFLAPLGLGIRASVPWWPWWALSAVPVGVMLLILLWVLLSWLNRLPIRMTPWALAPALLWIDCCCLSDESLELIVAGVTERQRFVARSEHLIAFISPSYFEELICVYELASFCKRFGGSELERRLLLLSVKWPSTFSPCKTKDASVEQGWLEAFSCDRARCPTPSDRAHLLAKIRDEWGSEQAFERFVRDRLPELLVKSKAAYRSQLTTVAAESFELLFGE